MNVWVSEFILLIVLTYSPLAAAETSYMNNSVPWLHTEGNRIVDQTGDVVILRGVSIEDPFMLEHVERRFGEGDFIELFRNWHARVIRVPVIPDLWEHEAYYAEQFLDPIVGWAGKYGAYVLLEWHAIGNPITGEGEQPTWRNDWPFHGNPFNPDMKLAIQFWHTTAERYKYSPQVLYGIFNEPSHISWKEWKRVAEQLVDVVRSHNPRALILVSGTSWGYDLREAGHDPIRRENIIYETHPYPGKFTSDGPWDQFFGFLSNDYPLFAGEWGFDPSSSDNNLNATTDNYGKPLLEYMNQKWMSWTAWCFSPEIPQMIQSWSYEPTEFGQLVKEALASPDHTIHRKLTIRVNDMSMGTTVPQPGEFWYDAWSAIHVNASVSIGYRLDHWDLDGSNMDAYSSPTVVMDAPHTLTAVFSSSSVTSLTVPKNVIRLIEVLVIATILLIVLAKGIMIISRRFQPH